MVRYRIFSERYLVITPKGVKKKLRSLDDLRSLSNVLPLVRFNRNSQVGVQIDRYLRRVEIRSPNRLELDNADALTSMVAEGIGWAITSPMCLLQGIAYASQVDVHIISQLALERSLFLVGRRDEYNAFFDDACEAARTVIEKSFLPRVKSVNEDLVQLIAVGERSAYE